MPLYPASRNGPRLHIDTKVIRVIGMMLLVDSNSESGKFQYELT